MTVHKKTVFFERITARSWDSTPSLFANKIDYLNIGIIGNEPTNYFLRNLYEARAMKALKVTKSLRRDFYFHHGLGVAATAARTFTPLQHSARSFDFAVPSIISLAKIRATSATIELKFNS